MSCNALCPVLSTCRIAVLKQTRVCCIFYHCKPTKYIPRSLLTHSPRETMARLGVASDENGNTKTALGALGTVCSGPDPDAEGNAKITLKVDVAS